MDRDVLINHFLTPRTVTSHHNTLNYEFNFLGKDNLYGFHVYGINHIKDKDDPHHTRWDLALESRMRCECIERLDMEKRLRN